MAIQNIFQPFDMRIAPCSWLHCFTVMIRVQQIYRVREILKRERNPNRKAKQKIYNHIPRVREKRMAAQLKRWKEDPDYRAAHNKGGVEYFKANKAKVYAYRKSRPDIYGTEATRPYIRNWQREKRRTDPNYRIGNRLRSRLWHAVEQCGGAKSAKTMELVGCTIPELRQHLESLFTDGMSWENIGKWHIDHKMPCAMFDLSKPEEQRKCFLWSNLQPLWEKDNLSKGDSFPLPSPVVVPQISPT